MRRITLTLASATAVLLTTATAFAGQPTNTAASAQDSNPMAETVAILDVDGNQIGTVRLRQGDNKVRVTAVPVRSTPGFHGFHIHDVGICDPEAEGGPFVTAGGHYEGGVDTNHGDHAGDMPSLLVKANGKSQLSFRTDRFSITKRDQCTGDLAVAKGWWPRCNGG